MHGEVCHVQKEGHLISNSLIDRLDRLHRDRPGQILPCRTIFELGVDGVVLAEPGEIQPPHGLPA